MKKQSSYQKLKAENKRLKQDIYNLTIDEESLAGITTKIRWLARFNMEKCFLYGNTTKREMHVSTGLYEQIAKATTKPTTSNLTLDTLHRWVADLKPSPLSNNPKDWKIFKLSKKKH